ncbi:CrcB family protein [Gordonia amarae]|uniref:Fluoride-specific ion channel FluC n=2 Tax=Gordonia amarae TaxID=36821 RepID=G7GL30_9ACTN|nr:CrcB family protein [Gordonia amarae]MCS3878986.1 CrcB protein [Gordonia amarae]QHN17530.1 CrcB family protein [Gordonia amarae]QHN22056.1 CrcB family protein [Gordonia amarae]QHN30937.1 CrcB family protein [Gordonia amarae]QHN39683.1 CrcB family protein [Gordonia amarae]
MHSDDAPAATAGPRPAHVRPDCIAAVFVGGCFGVAAREALVEVFPADGGIPWAVFAINIVGAFALGVLLESLSRYGPDTGRRRILRMLLGTGFMGGFTTYSALATDTADLLTSGSAGAGLAYGVATVIVGALVTMAGIAVGARCPRGGRRHA